MREGSLIYKGEVRVLCFSPNKRVLSGAAAACLIALCVLVCLPAWAAQPVAPAVAPAAVQPEAPPDSLGRNTPRGTVLGFLIASRTGQEEVAVQYLDTRLRGKAATELAHKLFTVLDRRLPPRLTQLSEKPDGSLADREQ